MTENKAKHDSIENPTGRELLERMVNGLEALEKQERSGKKDSEGFHQLQEIINDGESARKQLRKRLQTGTIKIANKPAQAIHLYFLIQFEINVAAKAINAIDKTKPNTSSP